MSVLLAVLLLWIAAVKLTSNYIVSRSSESQLDIVRENNDARVERLKNDFKKVVSELNNISGSITGNLDVRKSLDRSDSKRLFEDLNNFITDRNYNIDIFDKRIEEVYFRGRQLSPEILLIQKALNGASTTLIKEIGFFTYLIKYSPIYQLDDETKIQGVLICGIIIDSKYNTSQYGFSGKIFAKELSESLNDDIKIYPAVLPGLEFPADTLNAETGFIDLLSSEGSVLGRLTYTKYNFEEHKNNIEEFSALILSILAFLFTLILTPVLMKLVNLFKPLSIRLMLFLITLLLVRFFWIANSFPSAVINEDIFNPQFFASKLGFGVFQSLGDVLVTIIFVVIYSLYFMYNIFKHFIENRQEKYEAKIIPFVISFIVIILIYFGLFNVYGTVIQNLIFDSNIKLLDKSNIIPDAPLFIIQLSILLITFGYLLANVSLIIILISLSKNLFQFKNYRRFFILFIFLAFVLINEVFNLMSVNFLLINLHRVLITVLIFSFAAYLFKQKSSKRNIPLFSLRNISLSLLLCIVITPTVILEFTKSQETHFVENIGSELIEIQNDKIIFLLSDELSKIKDEIKLDKYVADQNKKQKLPYFIWSNSKFSYEKYKTDVILIDTSKKIISDFNNSNNLIKSDSVVSFIKKNYFSKNMQVGFDESDTLTEDSEFGDEDYDYGFDNSEPIFFNDVIILENKSDKYFAGILPLENADLKNTQYAEIKGYIVVAINTETVNLFTDNQFTGNVNLQGDKISDRLISKPIITEILNNVIINSTDIEVSKSVLKYIDLFKESIKISEVKSSWRYDQLVNERYRSYYIKSNDNGISSDERIFVVSIKRDDFSLLMFYFLKFVLFSLTVFVAFNVFYSAKFLLNIKRVNFDFRSKLFLSFIVVSVIPIVFLAVYTRTYINNKNDLSYKNQLLSDLSLLNETLKDEKVLFNRFKPADTIKQAGKDILSKGFENVDKNFNIFIKTKLVATTNEELYKSDFLDERVPEEGYFNILILKKDLYLESKEIQGQNYLVGYKPLKDRNNNINGIISSLSVYKQKEIQEELTETLTFIFGSYFIVIIILFVIVGVITTRLSKPISVLQEATERIAKGEENVVIDINRGDEFGSLVDSFNKMTRDLEKSKENLKKAEREAAWRDIARRVAHEIKNPLTPMKLSIQHLYNVYQEKDLENFEGLLKKTRDLITKEIDKLSKIATAFSDFAKLPQRNYVPLNINDTLEDVISLYSLNDKIFIEKNLSGNLNLVSADKQELNRVFQNLIKNAVQSFEDTGVIEVKSYNEGRKVVVEIIDNGCGIDDDILDKLFEPNFSTKSTGMGLGLSITKKSLDDMKAKIIFKSKKNEGTTVKIEFNIYNDKKH